MSLCLGRPVPPATAAPPGRERQLAWRCPPPPLPAVAAHGSRLTCSVSTDGPKGPSAVALQAPWVPCTVSTERRAAHLAEDAIDVARPAAARPGAALGPRLTCSVSTESPEGLPAVALQAPWLPRPGACTQGREGLDEDHKVLHAIKESNLNCTNADLDGGTAGWRSDHRASMQLGRPDSATTVIAR